MHGYSQILTPNPRGPDCLTAVDASVVQGHPACQFMSWSVPPAQLGCDQCSPPQRPPGSCGGPLVEHRRLRSLRCSWDACESDACSVAALHKRLRAWVRATGARAEDAMGVQCMHGFHGTGNCSVSSAHATYTAVGLNGRPHSLKSNVPYVTVSYGCCSNR